MHACVRERTAGGWVERRTYVTSSSVFFLEYVIQCCCRRIDRVREYKEIEHHYYACWRVSIDRSRARCPSLIRSRRVRMVETKQLSPCAQHRLHTEHLLWFQRRVNQSAYTSPDERASNGEKTRSIIYVQVKSLFSSQTNR
jgi:hypothetical protein